MTTRSSLEEIQQRTQFRLQQAELRKRDAEKSFAEHKAKKIADEAKTKRLRALRLAKEAQDAAAEVMAAQDRVKQQAPSVKIRVKKKSKEKLET